MDSDGFFFTRKLEPHCISTWTRPLSFSQRRSFHSMILLCIFSVTLYGNIWGYVLLHVALSSSSYLSRRLHWTLPVSLCSSNLTSVRTWIFLLHNKYVFISSLIQFFFFFLQMQKHSIALASVTCHPISLLCMSCLKYRAERAVSLSWPCLWRTVSHHQENSVESFRAQTLRTCCTTVCYSHLRFLRLAHSYRFMATVLKSRLLTPSV